MVQIKEDNEIITLINIHTVDKANQHKLVEMIEKANEQIYNKSLSQNYLSINNDTA